MTTITKSLLRDLNHQVDCKCAGNCFLGVANQLPPSEVRLLDAYLRQKANYILGKYYHRLSKLKSAKANLEKANEHFDEIFIIAGNRTVNNPKHWFKRIHTKGLLATHCDTQERSGLMAFAKFLHKGALELFPENDSILWLQEFFKKIDGNS